METKWKVFPILLSIIFIELCYGFPINLENSGTDSHTQLLTGLVAVLLTVCSIVALAGCLCCTRSNGFKEKDKEFQDIPVVVSVANNLDHGHVNPIANSEFTIFTPLSPPHYNNNIFLANQELLTRVEDDYKYGDIDVHSWFNQNEKEFPRTKLKYIRELGKGWFGRVVEGAAQDINEVQSWTPVVVRILEANTSNKDRILFLHDANIYRFGAHPNLLSLLGRSLDTVPMLLMQEYCSKGDLKKNLREHQDEKEIFLSSELPLRWCCHLALAIKYLHNQNIAHLDLAARNCLITDDLNLKVGDYGLSSSHYPEDYYLASPGLPIRWCSPESINYTSTTIQPNKVTLEANIWSLGVTMWEIFEFGKQPYSNLNDDEVVTQVLGPPSVKLPRPTTAVLYTDYMYRLMQMCWSSFELRPKISQIELMLEDLMQVHKNMKFDKEGNCDFDERWENLKPNTIVKTDNFLEDNVQSTESNNLMQIQSNCSNPNDMDSWLENIATNTDDLSYVRGLHDAMNDLDNVLALQNVSSSESSHRPSPALQTTRLEFKLGPLKKSNPLSTTGNDSLNDSIYVARTSSESETEEENWKKKIEKGVYSEKVRQKSRSVTDLMVLTHIDCSESDSETPLQSLDYRVNYKNVRLTQNLENTSLMFGSEGNLLNVKETFQEELRKLREERKDSLLFVPVTNKETDCLPQNKLDLVADNALPQTESPTNSTLIQDLNSPSDIRPTNQVYNVYQVTIESKFNPNHNSNTKLDEIINFHDLVNETTPDLKINEKLPDIISDIQINLSSSDKLTNAKIDNELQNVSDQQLVNNTNDSLIEHVESPVDINNIQIEICNDIIDSQTALKDNLINSSSNNDLIESKVDTNCEHENESLNNVIKHESHIYDVKSIANTVEILNTQNSPVNKVDFCENVHTDHIETSSPVNNSNLFNNNDQISQTSDVKCDNIESDTEDTDIQTEINLKENMCDSILSNISELGSDSSNFNIESEEYNISPNDTPTSNQHLENVIFGSCTDYTIDLYKGLKTCTNEAEELQFSSNFNPEDTTNECMNYSLDSWDNFLEKALDKQETNEAFDNFNSERQSLNFIASPQDNKNSEIQETTDHIGVINQEDDLNATFTIDPNSTFTIEDNTNGSEEWEAGEGWFLHDQSMPEELTGEMNIIENSNTDSYVGFSMDDDVMSAIRNELLMKLPQAQRISNEKMYEQEVADNGDKVEVFIKFNTPLSPIPEESFSESNSCQYSPHHCRSRQESDDDSDWTEPALQSNIDDIQGDTATQSPQILESPAKGPHHRHTPSQDSCCSNDTLFNLEELVAIEQDKFINKENNDLESNLSDLYTEENINIENKAKTTDALSKNQNIVLIIESDKENTTDNINIIQEHNVQNDLKYKYINDFINNERSNLSINKYIYPLDFLKTNNAPLPSPEDRQWTELHAPFLTCNNDTQENLNLNEENYVNINSNYENINPNDVIPEKLEYVNCTDVIYENTAIPQYINVNHAEKIEPLYVGKLNSDEDHLDEMYEPFTDIRFTGPCDNQLMSTSFSESNDLGDEQDWDSGSDTRSSSSGEFLWKHDEHEESVKALRVAPQELDIEDVANMEGNDKASESSGSEDEGDGPEFVPSAWDKYAIPIKSAMRSPEKTLEKIDKKSKGVWFKKQKYHCVYEYPKEPESPILQSCDLWQPALSDWDLDEHYTKVQDYDMQNGLGSHAINDVHSSSLGGDFFISGSTRPFDNVSGLGSEFFPGKCDNWTDFIKLNDNITPDSGIDDLTPGSITDVNELQTAITVLREVEPLKRLAAYVVNKTNNQNKVLGGLRHTRNKLKLDLPPSPTAFSSSKIFTVEPQEDLVIRSVPTFSTFGKSRFLVQHVDTPTDEKAENYKNVSFQALPHKPLQKQILKDDLTDQEKQNVEIVRGEASLLDSADEDSGIESCTLERKKIENNVMD